MPDVPGWTANGNFTVVEYGAPGGFPSSSDPGPPDRGQNFFAGGENNESSSASQAIDVSTEASQIDAGNVAFELSGYLGGFAHQPDNAKLTATFRDASNAGLGSATTGPVTPADRTNATGLLQRETEGSIPAATRKIEVQIQMTRLEGSYNDGYADNLSLLLTESPADDDGDGDGVPDSIDNCSDKPTLISRTLMVTESEMPATIVRIRPTLIRPMQTMMESGMPAKTVMGTVCRTTTITARIRPTLTRRMLTATAPGIYATRLLTAQTMTATVYQTARTTARPCPTPTS